MKKSLMIILLFLISLNCYSKKNYLIPKDFFVAQFSDSCILKRIYCLDEDNRKVWLFNIQSTILTIELNNNKKKEVKLSSTKFVNNKIETSFTDIVWGTNKPISIDFDEVKRIYIKSNFEIVSNYYNIDSCFRIVNILNDSLNKRYLEKRHLKINFVSKIGNDTLILAEEVCYNLKLKDNNTIYSGVIQKITNDSILITNSFNDNTAKFNKEDFRILKYSIRDIKEILTLKSNGLSRKINKTNDFNYYIENGNSSNKSPSWFELDIITGKILLYRPILCDKGYYFITEQDGRTVWLEY